MVTSAASGIQHFEQPLRRRMHILEKAHSHPSLNKLASTQNIKILPDMSHQSPHHQQDDPQPSSDFYESRSDSSEEDEREPLHASSESKPSRSKGKERDRRDRRPSIDTAHLQPGGRRAESTSPLSPGSRAWYEFDLAVVVALVSPIGNWLTGGDHIKNLLLVVLLIFYLHQIIEIPWALYQKSRPRRRPDHPLPPFSAGSSPTEAEERYRQLATSELRKIEFFFLSLTALSPFIGALLLRYASAAVLGPHAVSWFSTGLFVLATGMRPWAHVVERLKQRTSDLHDIIHYPSSVSTSADGQKDRLIEDLIMRVEKLEKSMGKMKSRMHNTTEEIFEYVDDAVDAVERSMKRQEKRTDKQETRVGEMEDLVATFTGMPKGKSKALAISSMALPTHSILAHILPRWLISPPRRDIYNGTSFTPPLLSPITSRHSRSPIHSPKHSLRSFPSSSFEPLETIMEEENATARYVPYWTSRIIWRLAYVATMPVRAAVRMMVRNY